MMPVPRRYTRSLLPTMLKGMEPQGNHGGGRIGPGDAKYATLFTEFVVIERMRCQQVLGVRCRRRMPRI